MGQTINYTENQKIFWIDNENDTNLKFAEKAVLIKYAALNADT